MYGMIGKFKAVEGKRDELAKILLKSVGDMPGCLSYVISKDSKDSSVLWIHEAWDSKNNHQGSLQLPEVKAAIKDAMPFIAGMEMIAETEPVGGFGLLLE